MILFLLLLLLWLLHLLLLWLLLLLLLILQLLPFLLLLPAPDLKLFWFEHPLNSVECLTSHHPPTRTVKSTVIVGGYCNVYSILKDS